MRPDIMSSEMTGGSVGGGGHTSESIMSSVAARITPFSSGGSVRDDLPPSLILHLLYKILNSKSQPKSFVF